MFFGVVYYFGGIDSRRMMWTWIDSALAKDKGIGNRQ